MSPSVMLALHRPQRSLWASACALALVACAPSEPPASLPGQVARPGAATDEPVTVALEQDPQRPERRRPGGEVVRIPVLAPDGTPVPGARARWIVGAEREALADYMFWTRGSTLDDAGSELRADETGSLTLARASLPGLLVCRHGDTFGYRAPREERVEGPLQLHPMRSLRARVVDEAGAPVSDFPVRLSGVTHIGRMVERSRADGSLRFDMYESSLDEEQGPLTLELDAFLREPQRHVLRGDDWSPPHVFELVAPPTGVAQVVARGPRPESHCFLRAWPADHPEPPRTAIPSSSLSDRDRFHWRVEVGVPLAVALSGAVQGTTTFELPGPSAPGELITRELRFLSGHLPARICDQEGRPLRDVALQCQVQHWRDARTDEAGRFELDLGVWPLVCLEQLTTQVHLRPRCAAAGFEPVVLDVTLPPAAGTVELRVERHPALISGVVVDARGRPLPGASVTLEQEEIRQGRSRWQQVRGLMNAQSRDDGTFEIRVEVTQPGALRVSARHEQHWFDPEQAVLFAPGEADVTLRALPSGAIHGRIVSGLEIAPRLLRPSAHSPAGRHLCACGISDAWEFLLTPVPAGPVDLRLNHGSTELALPGYQVREGETLEVVLDLTGSMLGFELEVLDERGLAVGAALVRRMGGEKLTSTDARRSNAGGYGRPFAGFPRASWEESARRGSWEPLSFPRARVVVASAEPLDLEVTAPGKRPAVLRGVTRGQRVVLRDGPAVNLIVVLGRALPAGVQVRGLLDDWWSEGSGVFPPYVVFDPPAGFRVRRSSAGSVTMTVCLCREGEQFPFPTALLRTAEVVFADGDEGELVIELGSEELEQALDELD